MKSPSNGQDFSSTGISMTRNAVGSSKKNVSIRFFNDTSQRHHFFTKTTNISLNCPRVVSRQHIQCIRLLLKITHGHPVEFQYNVLYLLSNRSRVWTLLLEDHSIHSLSDFPQPCTHQLAYVAISALERIRNSIKYSSAIWKTRFQRRGEGNFLGEVIVQKEMKRIFLIKLTKGTRNI